MKNILIISPEPWNAHTVSKHHYATTLANRDFTVYFLNPFDDTKKQLEIKQIQNQLYTISSSKVASGLRYYTPYLRNWLERRWLKKLEKEIGHTIDTIWLFENSRFFDLRFAGSRLKIYHQVDLNQNFNPALAAKTADICFCTSDIIRNSLISSTPLVYKIHHGLAHVEQNKSLATDRLNLLKNKEKKCIYVGNLEMLYLDAELLSDVASKFIDTKFHFIGGYDVEGRLYSLAKELPNVHWWGKIDSNLIPEILSYADILLVTYQEAHCRDQSSPHKFMEYFASGKVIVSTYTDEYKDKRHLLEMVDHNKDYIDIFEKVINNLDYYNSHEKQQQRIQFANEHSYEKQLDRILQLCQQHNLLSKP